MTALCVPSRAGASPRLWFLAALSVAILGIPAAAAGPIVVTLDQATIVKLPDRASTVVVGNPLIADLSLQSGGIGVVTGKGYGSTNFVVMDRTGAVLMEKTVEVRGPRENIVVVYRGVNQETYSCTPICQRRITLGDFPDYFDKTLAETTTRNAQAIAAAAAAGH